MEAMKKTASTEVIGSILGDGQDAKMEILDHFCALFSRHWGTLHAAKKNLLRDYSFGPPFALLRMRAFAKNARLFSVCGSVRPPYWPAPSHPRGFTKIHKRSVADAAGISGMARRTVAKSRQGRFICG
jgi:hypothetical protein